MAKEGLHPTYFPDARIICACGFTIPAGGTREKMSVEICSNCHPFYTGEEKLLDVAGRVEKFKTRRTKAASVTPVVKKPRVKKEKAS
jgi:large subunit ribosomal protein L31